MNYFTKKTSITALFALTLSCCLGQIIPTTISLNPSQVHTFTLEKTNMTLNPVSSGQNYGSGLYYYNGGAGSNYNFLIDYYRYKFVHTGIPNSDITNVTYSFNYAAHDDINHPTQPTWWSQSKFSVIVPPSGCNANYWSSYSLNDCLSTESCISNGGTLLAYIGPNGNGSGTTLTQSQSINGSALSSLLLNPNDFTIAFMPDGGVTCYIDLKSTMTAQVTYNTYPISNNILSGNQSYTGSANPTLITGSAPTGGNKNTFTYQWQSSLNNSTWTNISGATAASYDPPTIGQTTYYRRLVYSSPQPTSTSNVITITITPTLAPPTNLIAGNQTTSSLDLSWNHSVGATSYDVFTCSGTFVTNVMYPYSSCTISGLNSGTIYSYKVIAKNATTSSLPTACINVKTRLEEVTTINYSSTCNQLTLSWTPVTGATYYQIANCSAGGIVGTPSSANFVITGIAPGTTVSYAVTATDGSDFAGSVCNSYVIPNVTGGTATSSSSQICPGITSSLLNLTGSFGAIQWQRSVCDAAFQNITGETSTSYNVTSASGTGTSFRAKVTCGSTVAYSNVKIVSQYNTCNPDPATIPMCNGGGGSGSRMMLQGNTAEPDLTNDLRVYPNPASNEVSVEFSTTDASPVVISIYDLLGKKVYSSNESFTSSSFKRSINTASFNRGMYFVEIKSSYSTYVKRLIME